MRGAQRFDLTWLLLHLQLICGRFSLGQVPKAGSPLCEPVLWRPLWESSLQPYLWRAGPNTTSSSDPVSVPMPSVAAGATDLGDTLLMRCRGG